MTHRHRARRTPWWRRRYIRLYRYVAQHRRTEVIVQPVPVDRRVGLPPSFERAQWLTWDPNPGHERWQAAYK